LELQQSSNKTPAPFQRTRFISRNGSPLGYDGQGNLRRVSLPDGRVIEYVADGDNRRVGKKGRSRNKGPPGVFGAVAI
jgi:YD repeat-containing protein